MGQSQARPPTPKKPRYIGKYEVGELIGFGTYGKVYLAHNTENPGETVAIKALNIQNISDAGRYRIEKEAYIMKVLSHPNIVQLYDVVLTEAKIYLVMEYISGGNLWKQIQWEAPLAHDVARKYFQQLISAVHYCHVRGVIHRDLKPENLLVDADGNLKVSDFGLCATAAHRGRDGLLHTRCGTQGYTAPEVWSSKAGYAGAAADVYSSGVILYNMLTGVFPFDPSNEPRYIRLASTGKFQRPKGISGELHGLLKRLLAPNPVKRITIPEITKLVWFRKGLEALDLMAAAAQRPEVLEASDEMAGGVKSSNSSEPSKDTATANDKKVLEASEEMMVVDGTKFPEAAEERRDSASVTGADDTKVLEASEEMMVTGAEEMAAAALKRSKVREASEEMASKRPKVLEASEGGEAAVAGLRFTTTLSAPKIMARLEEIGREGGFCVAMDGLVVRMERVEGGGKGYLGIVVKVVELKRPLRMVEVIKSGGDGGEYERFCEEDLRLRLRGVVWAWQS